MVYRAAKALCYHIVCRRLCVCVVVVSSRFLFLQKLKFFGIRRIYKNDGWSCKKKILRFSALDRDDLLGTPRGTKIQRRRKYDIQPGGCPIILFSTHVVISAHRTNILENNILGPSTYPSCPIFEKVKKMVQYLEKRRTFLKKFVSRAQKFVHQKFKNFGTLVFVPRTQSINKKCQLWPVFAKTVTFGVQFSHFLTPQKIFVYLLGSTPAAAHTSFS